MPYVYIGIAGFLLGSFLYTGYYSVQYEPDVKFGYALIAIGISIAVGVTAWIDFIREHDGWYRGVTLLGYLLIALGLTSIVRARRRRH
jgi:hypothetical protein